jgi:hypothetical protein
MRVVLYPPTAEWFRPGHLAERRGIWLGVKNRVNTIHFIECQTAKH